MFPHQILHDSPYARLLCSSNIGAAELNIYGPAKGRGCLPTFVVLSAAVLQRSQCSGRKKYLNSFPPLMPPPPPEQSGVLSSAIRLSRAIRRLIKSYFRFNKRQVSQIKVGRGGVGEPACGATIWRLLFVNQLEKALCGWLRGRNGPCKRAAHRIVCRGQEGKKWREGGRGGELIKSALSTLWLLYLRRNAITPRDLP